ncbi:MAG TPA: hypothetical protein VMT93_07820 [Gemmatimonadaceae bacterium]|nr:hypothetical protein [Gemmatimonadaceae bacterium]
MHAQVLRGRHMIEDRRDDAQRAIRRRPFRSVALAFVAGALSTVAGVFAFRRRKSRFF